MIARLEIRLVYLSPDGHVYEKYTFPGLLTLLHAVPNLRHLILYSDRELSSDDISRLRLTPLQSHVPIPRLRVLDLSGCKLDFDHSSLVEIIKTRRKVIATDCDQLETLHLASPLLLDGEAADIWQNLLDEGLNVVYELELGHIFFTIYAPSDGEMVGRVGNSLFTAFSFIIFGTLRLSAVTCSEPTS
ncbi:hypothetical protein F5146DRAFT_712194 [Armillaria mellea]|nr:hypothetical protein F5146DRAFT_712194 [Armillaria mellea]